MRVVVLYVSRTGNTKTAAELIGGAVAQAGHDVVVRAAVDAHPDEVATADLLFVGTWVDGVIVAGHRPGQAGKVRSIPDLWGKQAAAFCTHAVHPGSAARKLGRLLEGKGATVVAARSFNARKLPEGIAEFVAEAMDSIHTPSR